MKDLKWNIDLIVSEGDFVIADSDQQHQTDIISSYKGNWKEFPLVGVGIDNYRNAPTDESELRSIIRKQLEADGYIVNQIIINTTTLEIYVDAVPS